MKLKLAYRQNMSLTNTGVKFCLLMLFFLILCLIMINTVSAKESNQANSQPNNKTHKKQVIKALYIPLHTRTAIIASLNPQLKVINYQHLNIDKAGLKQIMDLAVEGKIIKHGVNIDDFANENFRQNLAEL
ncbi:MAG: hypothetical protein JKY81_08705 [Colwellia sp.]|nr:hypothetical protein [Colwellia sp.]